MSSPGLVKSCVEDINLLLLIVCPKFFYIKVSDKMAYGNTADRGQTVLSEKGSTLPFRIDLLFRSG